VNIFSPQKGYFIALFNNITDRKQAGEALKESEARANALIKYAPTWIYEIDFRTQRIVSVNDVAFTLSQVTAIKNFFSTNLADILTEESKK